MVLKLMIAHLKRGGECVLAEKEGRVEDVCSCVEPVNQGGKKKLWSKASARLLRHKLSAPEKPGAAAKNNSGAQPHKIRMWDTEWDHQQTDRRYTDMLNILKHILLGVVSEEWPSSRHSVWQKYGG